MWDDKSPPEYGKILTLDPKEYKGVLKPYSYTFQEYRPGIWVADFISKYYIENDDENPYYVFHRVWASSEQFPNPKRTLRDLIRTFRATRKSVGATKKITSEDGKPFKIKAEDYNGVLAPYKYTIEEESTGLFTARWLVPLKVPSPAAGDPPVVYKFMKIWASLESSDPKATIRQAIKSSIPPK